MIRFAPCLALLFAMILPPALHAESMPAAYRAVMRAQYAARTQVAPLGAAESARLYDAYLRAIGTHSSHSGADAGPSSRPDPDGAATNP